MAAPFWKRAELVRLRREGVLTRDQICERLDLSTSCFRAILKKDAPELLRVKAWRPKNARRVGRRKGGEPNHYANGDYSYTRRWTGLDALPVRDQVPMEGSSIRAFTQFELMTGRTGRRNRAAA